MLNILIISDEAKQLYALFRSAGFFPESQELSAARTLDDEREQKVFDIAFLDVDAGKWQERLLDARHDMPVIAFGRPEIQRVIEALRLGASDFLLKPLTQDSLREVVERHKRRILTEKYGFDEIIGTSPAMQEIFGLIKKAAASESNVLITGESGTGKELIARAIHRWSPRSDRAFMTINCSAIPDTLLESELFGFEKGAFTGAQYTKKGLLEQADGGTVFFDEIGDVSPLFQTKILRVLQEGEIMRIGSMRHSTVDLRTIAATNRDLPSACRQGTFREDLFYRLNVINIHLPLLRDRREDITLLAKHFVRKHAPKRKDVLIKCISGEALGMLLDHPYPGNVRELENIIERAVSFANTSEILPADLPSSLSSATPKPSYESRHRLKDVLEAAEKESIRTALLEHNGNISRAATSLGIYRQQLQRKIKQYKISQ